MRKPLAIDLCTGLHGWTDGLVAEGYEVIGFDLEDMCRLFGAPRPPHVHLVIQDVLTLHGSQFRNATLIVASPPCQFFSYVAMPWSRAKALAERVRSDPAALARETALFDACFRIQREACEAASRHIPLIVENVRGAQKWVGRARWNWGSFYLWGDVPALMPPINRRKDYRKSPGESWNPTKPSYTKDHAWKSSGLNWSDRTKTGQDFTRVAGSQAIDASGVKGAPYSAWRQHAIKNNGGSWFGSYAEMKEGIKQGGDRFNASQPSISRMFSSKSPQRKFASAMIAKIPLPLSRYIGATFHPKVTA